MARINAYPYDTNVTDIDAWIGTDSVTRQTKQFTAAALANYLNIKGKISIGGQMNYRFIDTPSTTTGTFAFAAGGGDQTSWANITSIVISTSDLSNQVVTPFLAYLVDEQILFQDVAAKSSFGHYIIRGYTQLGPSSFYTLTLEYIGGNGNITTDNYYTLVNFYLEQGASGVTSVDSSNTTFIDMTPTTPTSGNVELTASLSATGTPGSTNFLRGDNTWAIVGTDIVEGTGTTNFVAKWLDTDTIGDSVIFDSGFNVGIGTNTPGKRLQVGNGALDDTIRVVYNDGEYTDIHGYGLEMSRTASYIRPVTDGTGNLNIGENLKSWNSVIQNADTHIFKKDTSEKMRITSAGNVGIGRTNPAVPLDVEGKIRSNDDNSADYLEIFCDGSVSGDSYIENTSNNIQIKSANATSFSTSGSVAMFIDNNQNVGIGTTSPSAKLQVEDLILNGSIFKITTSVAGALQPVFDARVAGNGNTEYDFNAYKSPTKKIQIIAANTASITQIDGTGGFDLKGHLRTSLQTVNGGGVLQLHRYGALSLNDDDAYAHIPSSALYINTLFNTSTDYLLLIANQGSDKLAIDLNGNVGIGTTSPSAQLHSNASGSAINYGMFTIDTNNWLNFFTGTGTAPGASAAGQGALFWKSGGVLRLGTSTSTAGAGFVDMVRIDTDGNVGIGTTSPSEKLHVNGNLELGTNPTLYWTSNTLNLQNKSIASIPVVNIMGNVNYGGRLQVEDELGLTAIRLRGDGNSYFNGGNVGIGTTSPTQKLDVAGSIRTNDQLTVFNTALSKQILKVNTEATTNTGIFKLSNGSNWGLLMRGQSNTPFIGSYFSGGLNITGFEDPAGTTTSGINLAKFVFGGTGGGSGHLTLNGDLKVTGNVGIGTTNPLAKLDITSTTDGVLLPRMTTTQVNAISSPENGLTVYNTTLNTLCFYNGSSWQKVTSANM